jgi:RNA binding exosome subunit
MDFEKLPSFSAADISIIIHATEDKNKILESICSSFSIDANKFRHTELIGHWGNRISLLTGNLESAEANRLVQKIVLSLSSVESSFEFVALFYRRKGKPIFEIRQTENLSKKDIAVRNGQYKITVQAC